MNDQIDANLTAQTSETTALVGRIRIGPFKMKPGTDLRAVFKRCNMFFAGEAHVQVEFRQKDNEVLIVSEGPGVLGYMVDSDGLEASASDVEECSRIILDGDQVVLCEGEHLLSDSQKLLFHTKIIKTGDEIVIQRQRLLVGA